MAAVPAPMAAPMAAEAPPPGVGCLDARTSQKSWMLLVVRESEDMLLLLLLLLLLFRRFTLVGDCVDMIPRDGNEERLAANVRRWKECRVE